MSTGRVLAAALAASLLLAACANAPGAAPNPRASEVPSASPEGSTAAVPSASPVPTASATPSPTAVFDPHPPFDDLSVTTDGILPLQIGVPLATNTGAAMVFLDEDHCYSEEMGITEGDLDRWIADYSLGMGPDGGEMRPFGVDGGASDPLWRIDIFTDQLATPEGIGIGSTLAEVQATYPDLVAGTSGVVSQVWWIEGGAGFVVFETQDNSDGLLPGVTEPEVILMRVISRDADPDFPAANSGNVAGACF